LQTRSTERQFDQQCPLAQTETHLATTAPGSSRRYPPHQLASERHWVLLHEVQVRYYASVISIFEAFEFVASITAFDYVTFAWTLCSFPILLWWLTLRPSKWVTLRVTFVTGRSSCQLIVSFPTIRVTFPTSTPHLHFIWDLLWMP
jgi:hypothetical protein